MNKMVKKPHEIEIIREGGIVMGEILDALAKLVKPGATTLEIDKEAERMIRKAGGRPAFKGYKTERDGIAFPSTICASINDEVVHGPAVPSRELKNGDIFSIDIGMEYPYLPGKSGFYTDTAITLPVGTVGSEAQHIMAVTHDALFKGIYAAIEGKSIADIGSAIEDYAKIFGVGIVKELVGHGVGYAVHEAPQIPNYFVRSLKNIILEDNMVLALEPMFSVGSGEVDFLDDGWTVTTKERVLSAHFEHTIVVRGGTPEIITLRPSEKNKK